MSIDSDIRDSILFFEKVRQGYPCDIQILVQERMADLFYANFEAPERLKGSKQLYGCRIRIVPDDSTEPCVRVALVRKYHKCITIR